MDPSFEEVELFLKSYELYYDCIGMMMIPEYVV